MRAKVRNVAIGVSFWAVVAFALIGVASLTLYVLGIPLDTHVAEWDDPVMQALTIWSVVGLVTYILCNRLIIRVITLLHKTMGSAEAWSALMFVLCSLGPVVLFGTIIVSIARWWRLELNTHWS